MQQLAGTASYSHGREKVPSRRDYFVLLLFFICSVPNFPAFLVPSGSENFPFYLVFAFLMLRPSTKIDPKALLLFLVMCFLICMVYLINPEDISLSTLKTIALLLSPIIALAILFPYFKLESMDFAVRFMVVLWFCLSALVFLPGIQVLDPLIQIFFGDRSGFSMLIGYTGTGILFSEPSYAAVFMAFLIGYSLQRRLYSIWTLLIISTIYLLANQSRTFLILSILIYSTILLMQFNLKKKLAFILLAWALVYVVIAIYSDNVLARTATMLYNLAQDRSLKEFVEVSPLIDGGRMLSTYVYWMSGLHFSTADMQLALTGDKFVKFIEQLDIELQASLIPIEVGYDELVNVIAYRSHLNLNLYVFSSIGFLTMLLYLLVFGFRLKLTPLILFSCIQLLSIGGIASSLLPFLGLYLNKLIVDKEKEKERKERHSRQVAAEQAGGALTAT